jgi:SAM-dependent methyltransferase
MKQLIKSIPLLGTMALAVKRKLFPGAEFTTSEEYWINRYKQGGNSGAGSYNNLAEFKGEVLNSFVIEKNIQTVIEFGCGDGNQLKHFQFPAYTGFDISELVVEKCRVEFQYDSSKQFFHVSYAPGHHADLSLSLDVIYHLIEDATYHTYMNQLFDASTGYVIIYSCDSEDTHEYAPHVRPRKFTNWIKNNRPDFKLVAHIPNKYPLEYGKTETTSFSDFFIYSRTTL